MNKRKPLDIKALALAGIIALTGCSYDSSQDDTEYLPTEMPTYTEYIPTYEQNVTQVYPAGTHYVRDVIGQIVFSKALSGKKTLTAPAGYRILSYDFDDSEVFLYCNTVPVKVTGTKIDDVFYPDNNFGVVEQATDVINPTLDGIYAPGTHYIRDVSWEPTLIKAFAGSETLTPPEGYDILSCDYDGDSQVVLYVNNTTVKVNGTLIEQDEYNSEAYFIPNDEFGVLVKDKTYSK